MKYQNKLEKIKEIIRTDECSNCQDYYTGYCRGLNECANDTLTDILQIIEGETDD